MRFVWPIHYADPAALGEIAQRTPIRLRDSPIVEIAKLLARFDTGGTSSVMLDGNPSASAVIHTIRLGRSSGGWMV